MKLTPEERKSFNQYQQCGFLHPFTCGTKEKHVPGADEDLIAKEDGLYCPSCDYVQYWAHDFMLNSEWESLDPFRKQTSE